MQQAARRSISEPSPVTPPTYGRKGQKRGQKSRKGEAEKGTTPFLLGNIGHFDNEIDMAGLKAIEGIERINIKPQYDEWRFADGHSVMILAEDRLLNLGCATGHPSFVMSASFTNQVLAQIELHENEDSYENKVYVLPKKLDEEVARLHLAHLDAHLSTLTKEQADYIGVDVEGPYKPDTYRY